MKNPTSRNDTSDHDAGARRNQFENSPETLAERVRARLGDRDFAWLAREAGIPTSTLHSVLGGTMPRADNALRLARVLGCSVEWLVSGEGSAGGGSLAAPAAPRAPADAQIIRLPVFEILDLVESRTAEPVQTIAVDRQTLPDDARRCAKLWLCRSASPAIHPASGGGRLLLCTDQGSTLVDGHVYILTLDGRPLVRRVSVGVGGVVLRADGGAEPAIEVDLGPQSTAELRAVARVVAVLSTRPA